MSKFQTVERDFFDKQTLTEINSKYKISAKTPGQQYLLDTIDDCTVTLCTGPAGTGKTLLGLYKGLEGLRANKYDKIVLIRPAIECGQTLGYMPGDYDAKISMYMTVFLEFFDELMSKQEYERLVATEKIVLETCQYIRGRTFKRTYILVDEAQNFKFGQHKMLLTRFGEHSKIIMVGDCSQTDLPIYHWYNGELGLSGGAKVPYDVTIDRMDDIDDEIGIVELGPEDIVRHPLLVKIDRVMK